jgi:hypothetical protein
VINVWKGPESDPGHAVSGASLEMASVCASDAHKIIPAVLDSEIYTSHAGRYKSIRGINPVLACDRDAGNHAAISIKVKIAYAMVTRLWQCIRSALLDPPVLEMCF